MQGAAAGGDRAQRVKSLLSKDESTVLEFKLWPPSLQVHPQGSGGMEETIAKALCGLANTEGGDLLVGVNDGGGVEGLAPGGARRLSRKDRGEKMEWVANVIVDHVGAEHDGRFDLEVVEVDGLDILHFSVAASKDGPVILKKRLEGKHDFFVRAGNTSRALGSREMLEHVKTKWPEWSSRPQAMGQSTAALPGPGFHVGDLDSLAFAAQALMKSAVEIAGKRQAGAR